MLLYRPTGCARLRSLLQSALLVGSSLCGQDVLRISPIPFLMVRGLHAMATDPQRQCVVLFGGIAGSTVALADTWEYDGIDWRQRHPQHSPSARFGNALWFDPVRRKVVLFGGLKRLTTAPYLAAYDDMWEWDGNDWTAIPVIVRPPPRGVAMSAYDSRRNRLVLYGGIDQLVPLGWVPVSDSRTWEFDGFGWSGTVANTTLPLAYGAPCAFHSGTGLTVMGVEGSAIGFFEKYYGWDGTDWHFLQATGALPPARYGGAGMSEDPATGKLLLHGGETTITQLFDDSWTWDGVMWTNVTTSTQPPRRNMSVLVPSPRAKKLLLWGGIASPSSLPNRNDVNLWEWDGLTKAWTRPLAVEKPTYLAGQAYDEREDLFVCCGRDGGAPSTFVSLYTWSYDRGLHLLGSTVQYMWTGQVVVPCAARQSYIMPGVIKLSTSSHVWLEWRNGVFSELPGVPSELIDWAVPMFAIPGTSLCLVIKDNVYDKEEAWLYDGSQFVRKSSTTIPSAYGGGCSWNLDRQLLNVVGLRPRGVVNTGCDILEYSVATDTWKTRVAMVPTAMFPDSRTTVKLTPIPFGEVDRILVVGAPDVSQSWAESMAMVSEIRQNSWQTVNWNGQCNLRSYLGFGSYTIGAAWDSVRRRYFGLTSGQDRSGTAEHLGYYFDFVDRPAFVTNPVDVRTPGNLLASVRIPSCGLGFSWWILSGSVTPYCRTPIPGVTLPSAFDWLATATAAIPLVTPCDAAGVSSLSVPIPPGVDQWLRTAAGTCIGFTAATYDPVVVPEALVLQFLR